MSTRRASAPAKIILSGEYAVVFGYPGIAIPAPFGITATFEEDLGRPGIEISWNNAPENRCSRSYNNFSHESMSSSCVDSRWIEYLHEIIEYCQKKNDQLFGKLTIEADAPLGKGMGSSTALIIAVTRTLLGDDCEDIARHIEDEMNPGHSGIDFATIWNNAPIEFRKGEEPKIIRLEKDLLADSTLIDTGTPNETTPDLVAWMESRQSDVTDALETIGDCTERIIKGEDLRKIIRDHYKAQVALGVVPEDVQILIQKIEDEGGAAKVIGAGARSGGAGMVLAWRNF